MRALVTAVDVARAPEDSELKVPRGALVTPAARDLAETRRVRLVEADPDQIPGPPPDRIVALGSDHAGFRMKEALKPVFAELGLEVHDVGVEYEKPVDYPDIAQAVAELVAAGAAGRGVIVDGAGIGSAIAANKAPGIRAALCYDKASARNSREHNNANVVTLGGRLLTETQAREVLYTWLTTPFLGGRHAGRVEKIAALERRYRTWTPSSSEKS